MSESKNELVCYNDPPLPLITLSMQLHWWCQTIENADKSKGRLHEITVKVVEVKRLCLLPISFGMTWCEYRRSFCWSLGHCRRYIRMSSNYLPQIAWHQDYGRWPHSDLSTVQVLASNYPKNLLLKYLYANGFLPLIYHYNMPIGAWVVIGIALEWCVLVHIRCVQLGV